ncbi:ecotropic viral integration site, partial [Perkinsus olseni]
LNPDHPVIKDLLEKVKEDKAEKKAEDTAVVLFQAAMLDSGYEIVDPHALVKKVYSLMSESLGVDPSTPVEEVEVPEDEEEVEEPSEEESDIDNATTITEEPEEDFTTEEETSVESDDELAYHIQLCFSIRGCSVDVTQWATLGVCVDNIDSICLRQDCTFLVDWMRGHHRKRWPVAVDGRGHRYRIPTGKGANDGVVGVWAEGKSSVTSPTLSGTTQENPYSSSSSSKHCSLPEPPETVTDHTSTSSSSVSRTPCASGSVVDTRTSPGPLSSVADRALTLAIPRGYLSIKDVVKCSELVCSRWRSLGQRKWLKLAVCHCSVEDGEERRWFWMDYCGRVRDLPLLREFDGDIRKCYDYYVHTGVDEYSELEHEIARDVRRTLPTHELFVRDQGGIHEKLKNVLIAVANANPTVGYCQGMNFIAAVLLLHLDLDPANAFIMMQCLLDNYHYRYLFSPGVPLLPLRMRQFSCVARKNLPALWHHLNSHSFTMDVFAQQWVMTLFGYYVDADFLKYVYDLFFLCGWKAVFKTGMAILAALEPKILKMNMEEISHYMQNSKHGTDFMRAHDDTGRRLAQERAMLKILNGCKVVVLLLLASGVMLVSTSGDQS